MTFAGFLIGLDRVPSVGAIYVGTSLKFNKQNGSPIRAMAFVSEPITS
jgi:kynurenine formamidase